MKQNIYFNRYRKVEAAYSGEAVEQYLEKFYREDEDAFLERKQNLSYLNYTRSVVHSVINPIFSSQIIRNDSENKLTNVFLSNTDVKGSTIDDIMRDAMIQFKLKNNCFIVVNNFEFDEESNDSTIEEISENRLLPYINIKKMEELYQYDTDDNGRLTCIEFINEIENASITSGMKYEYNMDKTAVQSIPLSESVEIIGYTNDSIYTYKLGDEEDKEETVNPFGYIPVISMNSEICPYPAFYDFASTNLAIMNQLSEARRMERESAFSILEIVTDLPIKDVELGSMNIITRPTNASGSSQFLSTNPAIISAVRESAKDFVELLLKQADLLGSTVNNSGASKSGVAYSYEFLGKDFELKKNAKNAEETEKMIAYVINKIISSILWSPEYPVEFINVTQEVSNILDIITKVQGLGITIPTEVNDYITEKLIKLVNKNI